jgi:hypothetical protein
MTDDDRTWALANGYTFAWADDWDLGTSHAKFYGPGAYDDYVNGEPDSCELCTMLNADGDIVDSLGCIDGADADDDHRREIESDMASVVRPMREREDRRRRSTMRARKRSLTRSP